MTETTTLTPVPGAELCYDDDGAPIVDVLTCGTCGRSWNDAAISGVTPVPSGRCPFEYDHAPEYATLEEYERANESRTHAGRFPETYANDARQIEHGDPDLVEMDAGIRAAEGSSSTYGGEEEADRRTAADLEHAAARLELEAVTYARDVAQGGQLLARRNRDAAATLRRLAEEHGG